MWPSKLPIHWRLGYQQLSPVRITCLKIVALLTCHHSQTRACQQIQLLPLYAALDWLFRMPHFGLFLRFGILFWSHSTIFGRISIMVVVCEVYALMKPFFQISSSLTFNCEVYSSGGLSTGLLIETTWKLEATCFFFWRQLVRTLSQIRHEWILYV
jgi:hypothetical protein